MPESPGLDSMSYTETNSDMANESGVMLSPRGTAFAGIDDKSSQSQTENDDVVIIEPPSKKAKCSPSAVRQPLHATRPVKGTLLGHLTVIEASATLLEKKCSQNNTCTVEDKSDGGLKRTNNEENILIDHSPPAKISPCQNGGSMSKLQKQQEKQRLRDKREREKKIAHMKKLEEKLEKQREKEIREQERREKKEQEQKEKEERQKRREQDRKFKELTQQCKERERQKKDEERRKREEERIMLIEQKKQKQEEEEKKREKAKSTFKSFFIKKSSSPKSVTENGGLFQPFELKPRMSLAPCVRRKLGLSMLDMDNLLASQSTTCLYIEEKQPVWRRDKSQFVTRKSSRRRLEREGNTDICIVETDTPDMQSEQRKSMTAKLLQFHANTRPAYYGTWTKRSSLINGRRPFRKDEHFLEYDYDSDDEWVEEEPGESLSSVEDDGEEDANDAEDEEDGDGFFVPHGYLSDDEGVQSEGEQDGVAGNSDMPNAYENDWTKKNNTLKPVVLCHPFVLGEEQDLPALLQDLKIQVLVPLPIDVSSFTAPEAKSDAIVDGSSNTKRRLHQPVPDEGIPYLIRHIHGNRQGLHKLIASFQQNWANPAMFTELPVRSPISKRQLERKILSISERNADHIKSGQYIVHPHILERYQLGGLTMPSDQPSPATPVGT